jgi:hypothetical protein
MFPVILLVGVGLVFILAQSKNKAIPAERPPLANAGEAVYKKIHRRVPMRNWAALSGANRTMANELVNAAIIDIRSGRGTLRDVGAAIAGPLIQLGNPNDPAAFTSFSLDKNLQNNVISDVRNVLRDLTGDS